MPSTNRIVLTPSNDMTALVAAYADEKGLEPSDAAEDLVRMGLLSLGRGGDAVERVRAEAEILEFVDEVAPVVGAGVPEDATERVFRRIEEDRLETYAIAVGGAPYDRGNREKARINRGIGRRTKGRLGADVVRDADGRSCMRFTPAGTRSLITAFTLLRPGSVA